MIVTAPRCDIAIAGFGGVGRAVAELLQARRARYRAVYDVDVRLVALCGSKAGLVNPEGLNEGAGAAGHLQDGLTGREFLNAVPFDVLIEAGPTEFRTGEPGLGYMRDALTRGCHVIAISKGALVVHGMELRQLAASAGVQLKVSGATAAALPTIDLLKFNLLGCDVLRIEGILNGTTNYLLTEMIERGLPFAEALQRAQQHGIAEADPSFDVGGWDTACKLVIIANFGLGAELTLADISVSGIAQLDQAQIADWRRSGLMPRLVGHVARTDGRWSGGVGVRACAADDPFSLVGGKNKAIRIDASDMGDIFVAGGASGTRATAAAALKDLEHILGGMAVR